MAVTVHYCDDCGIRIEHEDFDDGKAVIVDNRAYCPKCAKKLKAAQKEPPKQPKPISQRKRTTRVAPLKKKTTTSLARRPRREEGTGEYGSRSLAPVTAQKKSPLFLVLGICGAVIVVIIIAVLASGGSDKPAPRAYSEEEPPESPGYQPEYPPEPPEPVVPQEEPPRVSAALRGYQDAKEYGNNNPEDYDEVVERLETILREETIDLALSNRIQLTLSEWMGRWEAAAKVEWDNTSKAADKLIADGGYEAAAMLWDNFPAKHKNYGTYGEESESEARRLRKQKEAISALKEIEEDIKAAEKKFTTDEIEQAEKLLEKLCEFGRKFQDIEPIVKKLEPVVVKLRDEIEELEQEKFAKEFEEFNKQQEEERKKKEQERWTALKTLWQDFYKQYDQNSHALTNGSHVLFDGSSTKGWMASSRAQGVSWTVRNSAIFGQNTSGNLTTLLTHYREAYFWENYTFTLKIHLVAGQCSVGVRTNINDQKQISGTTFPVPAGQWTEMKIEVNGDAATLYVDGKQSGGRNTGYPAGYPAVFLAPNSQVEFKDAALELKSSRK